MSKYSPQLSLALTGNSSASSPWLSSALTGNFLGLKALAVVGLDKQFPWPQARSCHWPQQAIPRPQALSSCWPQRAISSASSPWLLLASTGDLLGLKPSAVVGLDGQLPRPQAWSSHWPWRAIPWPQTLSSCRPQWVISLASSPWLSLALTGNFLGLKPGAVISLDGQFPWPQARSCH